MLFSDVPLDLACSSSSPPSSPRISRLPPISICEKTRSFPEREPEVREAQDELSPRSESSNFNAFRPWVQEEEANREEKDQKSPSPSPILNYSSTGTMPNNCKFCQESLLSNFTKIFVDYNVCVYLLNVISKRFR